jgi:alpha-mannosidase
MSLTKEWLNRITHWDSALWQICYEPLATLELTGFVTQKHLSVEQASNHKFRPMPKGTLWGAKWQYGWFKTEITLPEVAAGRRIVLYMNPAAKSPEDGECLVWANGKIIGSYGWARREITLTRYGIPGEKFSILAEAYAGHGPMVVGGGPIRYGQESVPQVIKPQVIVGESSFGIWREQLYQLALDFTTLFELQRCLDPASLRVSEIDQGLKDVTLLIDLELPEPEMLETIHLCRERLRPLLDCVNGSTAPTFYAFGHAHLDVAWLWPLAETDRKIARTVINQLSLMDEYPDYRFLQSQPHLYTMLKNRYPDLFERFKQAILAGKVIADGAMWVEADTNLISGESLIRQIMYAKQFFKEEFSINTELLWLPDVFGYSGALPQILISCGCTSFATQKITWLYHGGDKFPYNTFLWEGIDGTTIPAHIFTDYNSETRPGSLVDRWETRLQTDGIRSMLLAFGWGDGGGGPTRDHLEFLSRAKDLEGLPRVKLATPAQFFADLKLQGLPKERYVGELYFQAHRGTYTSQAKTKQGNRRSEFSLREAEFWGSIARTLNNFSFTQNTLKSSWLKLLLNQFHDILPGSSIHRVYEESASDFNKVIASSSNITYAAASTFTRKEDSVTVFNSLSWDRTVLLDFPDGSEFVTVPACGWTTIEHNKRLNKPLCEPEHDIKATKNSLENDIFSARFNHRGELTCFTDNETGIEMLAGAGNRFCLYKDIPSRFDAWDIDSMTENLIIPTDEPVQLEVVRCDPYKAKIKLTRKIHHSSITQLISLQKGSRRIDFETTVDWQESHKLLKVAFPINIHSAEAIHEIQFGHIRRPNHRSRPFDADQFEVCNHKWTALAEENRGVAILNDSKYGINVLGNSMNLTLLKSSLAPDPMADKGIHNFTYSIFFWNGSFGECDIVHEAYELNCPVMIRPGASGEASIFRIDSPNIILETVKPAEDGTRDIILRLYESKRSLTNCILSTILPVINVSQTDMLERFLNDLPIIKGKIPLEFRPFEVKTIRLSFKKCNVI